MVAKSQIGAIPGYELQALLFKKARDIESVSLCTWDMLASVVKPTETGGDLRDKSLRAMHRMLSYAHQHAFQVLQTYPLSLVQGDVRSNIAALLRCDFESLDSVTARVFICADTGLVPLGDIERALCLLRETPCSTCLVEKGHGAGAVIKRYHARYNEHLLCDRALLAQAANFFSIAPLTREDRLRARIDALQTQKSFYNAKHEYLSRSMTSVEAPTEAAASVQRAATITDHGDLYAALTLLEKQELTEAAADERRRRDAARGVTVQALRQESRHRHCGVVISERAPPCPGTRSGQYIDTSCL